MYITRALIGRNPCLDQAIQTRKTIVLLLFYKTITLRFPCLAIQTLGNVADPNTWECCSSSFSYPEPFLRAVNRRRRGALAKSKPDTIKTWYPVKHCACSTSNADKHFDFLVCFILKVFLQENPTKAVGFANFIYLNQLVGNT